MLDSAFISYVTVMSITPGPNNLLLARRVNFGLQDFFFSAQPVSLWQSLNGGMDENKKLNLKPSLRRVPSVP